MWTRGRLVAAAATATAGVAAAFSPLSPLSLARTGGQVTMAAPARAATTIAAPLAVRVVSYNILSSHLAGPAHFVKCKPDDLDADVRIGRVKSALRAHMERDAVICLQEVSVQYVGQLTPFFEEAGYTFVAGNYGNTFNNYMGVALAWPKARFASEAVEIARAADAKPWPKDPSHVKPPRAEEPVGLARMVRRIEAAGAQIGHASDFADSYVGLSRML